MSTHLAAGQKAPGFSGVDQFGNKISLTGLKGQKVVLYFYPEDDTPTCTAQACNLRDHYLALQQQGLKIIGISPNEMRDHEKFGKKYDLPFSLLADPNHKIIDNYGVWGPKQMFGHKYMGLIRTTFIIDEKGIIQKIFLKPKAAQHTREILESLHNK